MGLDERESSSRCVNFPNKIENMKTVTYGPKPNPERIVSMSVRGPGLGKEVGEN